MRRAIIPALLLVLVSVVLGATVFREQVAQAAATLLPPNSVGTRQVINGSLLKKDFKAGQLPRGLRGLRGPQGAQGAQGVQGIQGTQGAQGIQGAQGAPGLSGYVGGSGGTPTVSVAPGTEGSATTFCPAGTQVLFGGFFSQTSPSSLRVVTSSLFFSDPGLLPGWEVTMTNEGATAQSFHVLVRCAQVS